MMELPFIDTHQIQLASSDESDVLIISSDKTIFHTSSTVIFTSSSLSELAHQLPQKGKSNDYIYSIELEESAEAIEPLLRLLSGVDISGWRYTDEDKLCQVLQAADKYEMDGPISIIQKFIMPHIIHQNPLLAYAIAAHYEWENIAISASTGTLIIDIHNNTKSEILSSIRSTYIHRLYVLHHSRVELFSQFADILIDTETRCSPPCRQPTNKSARREFFCSLLAELKKRPLGDRLNGESQFEESPFFVGYRQAECIHQVEKLFTAVQERLDNLPRSI